MQKTTVHHGCLCLLLVALWAGSGQVKAVTVRADQQYLIDSLQDALKKYTTALTQTIPEEVLSIQPCPDTAEQQNDLAAVKLFQYQACLKSVNVTVNDTILNNVNKLNRDLIQSLRGTLPSVVECPTSLSPQTTDPFVSLCKSIQCLNCWSSQVAALKKQQTNTQ